MPLWQSLLLNLGGLALLGGLLLYFLKGFEKNLFAVQRESERTEEQRLSNLRAELQAQLSETRKELQTSLMRLDTKVSGQLEKSLKDGFLQFEKVQQHLKTAEKELVHLNIVGQSINELNQLLKLPHLRGSFGEAQLEKILSDILPNGSFELQYKIGNESLDRVDAVVHYPNQVLPIDSKFPREQILHLFEAKGAKELEQAQKTLSEVMRTLAKQIRDKYIKPELGTTEFALLFVPSETLYFEIIRHASLCDEMARLKVFVVSPHTLAVTLHNLSLAKKYYEMAKGVESTLTETRKARQHFLNFEKKWEDVGVSLTRAQTAYGMAGTHLSRYESSVTRLLGDSVESGDAEKVVDVPVPMQPILPIS